MVPVFMETADEHGDYLIVIILYNLKEINFPSHQKDWKMFELDNKSVVLNFLFVPYNLQKEDTHTDQNII